MSRRVFRRYVLPALTIAGLIALWQVLSLALDIPVWLLPAPTLIFQKLVEWGDKLPLHTWVTLYETLAGFALAIAVGLPLAILIVYSEVLQNTIYPILVIFQSVPKVAIAPLFLVWVGYGAVSKVLVAFLVAFFPIVVDTATGLNAVPPELMELMKVLRASPYHIFKKIRFPAALPHIFSGLKVAITLSVIGAVIGEFVGSDKGLGYLILISSSHMDTGLAFGSMAILAVIGIGLFIGVAWLERVICPWQSTEPQ